MLTTEDRPKAFRVHIKNTQSKQGGRIVGNECRVLMLDLLPTVPYYTGYLCEGLDKCHEVDVSLAASTYRYDSNCFARKGMHPRHVALDFVSRIPSSATLIRRPLKLIEYLYNLAALALRFLFSRPEIVHVQFAPLISQGLPFEIWFVKWARALGCKIVYTVHNVLPHEHAERFRSLYARLYRLADHLICHDQRAKEAVSTGFQIPAEKISVIPHGPLLSTEVDHHPTLSRERLGISANEFVVLWQGIVRPYKGLSFLLKAWKEVCDKGLKATLVIAGTGDKGILEAVKRDVQGLGIASSVRLDLRFIPVERLEDYLSAADILVYPYACVTTSGALMTGISYSKAVIASALPGFQELLRHEENGLLAPYGDRGAWAAALQRLASDRDLRNRLGDSLRKSDAAQLSWTDIASETVGVYQRVLSLVTEDGMTTVAGSGQHRADRNRCVQL